MQINRHKTALSRYDFSKPISIAIQHSIITPDRTIFDYGCGKGDDVRLLSEREYKALGWDPAHFQNNEKKTAEVVNLGYVINVIEDINERAQALRDAFSLATNCLIVSAQVIAQHNQSDGVPHGDGVLTSRHTFQKYYTQAELRDYIISILETDPIAACPGVFYLFKSEVEKEAFLASRVRRLYVARPRRIIDIEERLKPYRSLLEDYANRVGELGRIPKEDEFEQHNELKSKVGSLKHCLSYCESLFDNFNFQALRQAKIDDLLVYIALSNFGKHPKFSSLPIALQRDIKDFFGNYNNSVTLARELLFSLGNPQNINQACARSHIGKLLPDALYVHSDYINSLLPILRLFIACGTILTGEIIGANIVKIKRYKSELSFLTYEEFNKDPHPKLSKSLKIYFKNLGMSERVYDGANRPILHRKETFVGEDYKDYDKFKKLTSQEEKAGLLDDTKTIGYLENWDNLLREKGLSLKGHRLIKNTSL